MADYLSRAFRVKLTTAMETVVRTAVFEITQIFENSLHDHQVDLVQKGEEIAQLKIKLQRAEIRLSEVLGDGGVEMSQNHSPKNQKESEKTRTPPGQSSAVPEIDFEVPDDWCVPLDSENVTRQEDFCPSVRLRNFSIPLCPISIPKIKQEEVYLNIEEPRPKRSVRKSKNVTAFHEASARTKDKSLPKTIRRSQRGIVAVNKKVKSLLPDIEQEYLKFKMEPLAPRRRLTGKEQESCKIKTKTDKPQNSAAGMTYPCKFCSKVFPTVFGRKVHIRSHKKCSGCKKVFPFPSFLQRHKENCSKYMNLMAVKSSNAQPSESITKGKSSSIKQISEKDKPSWKRSTRLVKVRTKKTCTQCNRKFSLYAHLKKHTCTGEHSFTCETCPKKFKNEMALKVHVTKMHKDSMEKNVDLSWTKPLEEIEESLSGIPQKAYKTKVGGKHKLLKKKAWESVATQCPEGFKCLYCKNIFKSPDSVIEHAQTHSGEKPFKCHYCPAAFSHRGDLYDHKIKQHVHEKKNYTCRCGETFSKKSKYKDHKVNFHKV